MQPFCIIMECCSHGDLNNYNQDWSHFFGWRFRLKVAYDITHGLNFLHGTSNPTRSSSSALPHFSHSLS